MSKAQKEVVNSCKRVLGDNNVPLNKIKFILEPAFTYDVTKDRINPTYKRLIPKNKNLSVIEINKPYHLMTIFVGEYRTLDNFKHLKNAVKRTKRGVVVWANNTIDYHEMIGVSDLDNAVAYYFNKQNFEN